MGLDRIDTAILAALQNNARLSNKELAAAVDLAPSSCLERVRKLQESGVLQGYHAEVDPAALGVELQAMVAVRMREHSRDKVESFRQAALQRREVLAVYYLAGATDFLIHVAVSGPEHLRDLVIDAFSVPGEVDRVETSLIFDHSRRWELPSYATTQGR
jgi:DNA-binding Lrp family transcriptional regulator